MKKWFLLALLTAGLTACSSSPTQKKAAEADGSTVTAETSEAQAAAQTAQTAEKKAVEAREKTPGQILCEAQNDKRYIEVKTKGGGCELAYTKFDKEEVIATSMSGTEHCEKIAERITNNLKEAGFSCGK
jgi:hypothetical protein